MDVSDGVFHVANVSPLRGITRAKGKAIILFNATLGAAFVQVLAEIVICRQQSARALNLGRNWTCSTILRYL